MAPSPPSSPSVRLGLRMMINSRRPEIATIQQLSSAVLTLLPGWLTTKAIPWEYRSG